MTDRKEPELDGTETSRIVPGERIGGDRAKRSKATPVEITVNRPRRHLIRMVLFVIIALLFLAVINEPLSRIFMANPPLNGLIAGVLLVGIIYTFRQVFQLGSEVRWLNRFAASGGHLDEEDNPVLLAPMAAMLRNRKSSSAPLSALSTRSILDSVGTRLDENRDISRYMIGLLIFLGLLGTFWGLLGTISAIGNTVNSLTVGSGDISNVFEELKSGLQAPLSGMSTAFASSLFGLGGSLVVGFLDLQSSQAQNRFFTELEDWLAEQTRVTSAGIGADGEGGNVNAYVTALLEQSAESIEQLQRTIAKSETGRGGLAEAMTNLGAQMANLNDTLSVQQQLMKTMAEGQHALKSLLEKQAGGGEIMLDQASRTHLRNLDVSLQQLTHSSDSGREQMTQDIRSEIKLLARTLSALGDSRD